MKILASVDRPIGQSHWNKETIYIVEISHEEIAKVSNKATYRRMADDDKELSKLLQPGMEYPIAEGHDFRRDIVAAVDAMKAAHEKCTPVASAMAAFANLIHTKETEA